MHRHIMLLSPPLRRRLLSSSSAVASTITSDSSARRSGFITSRGSTQQHLLTAATSRQRQQQPSSNSTGGGLFFHHSSFPSPPLLLLNKPHQHHYAQHQQQQHFSGHHHQPRLSARSLLHLARDLHSAPSQGPQDKEEKGGGEQPKKGSPSQSPQHPTVVKAANHEDHARETIWTVPNLITLGRIASSPVISWFILQGEYKIALAGLAVAAASDWVDGYIAKNYNQASVLGGFLDPLADKVLIAALTIPLAWQGHLPVPLLVVVFGRDALLVGGSFIKRALHRPPDAPFFDTTSSATFQITPNLLSKANTVLQFSVLTFALSRAVWGDGVPPALDDLFEPLCWLTGATTIGSGLSYLAGDGTASLLKKIGEKKEGKGEGKE